MPDIVKELKIETAFGIKKYNWTEKQARFLYNKSVIHILCEKLKYY